VAFDIGSPLRERRASLGNLSACLATGQPAVSSADQVAGGGSRYILMMSMMSALAESVAVAHRHRGDVVAVGMVSDQEA